MSNQFNLETIEVNQLPELQGWKEKQLKIVEENPFIKIIDNKTFEQAKKSRTNLVTARTTIQNQDKLIASKLTDFRKKVSEATNSLIAITLPYEEKQQEEVRRYEAEKEAEKLAKEKAEAERKEAIQNKIETIYQTEKSKIDALTYDKIEAFKTEFEEFEKSNDSEEFEEFELQFASKIQALKQHLGEKIQNLTEKENQRIEAEKLAQEKAQFEAHKQAQEKAEREEREKREAEQKAIDEANAKRQAELDAKEKALKEAEEKRQAEIIAEQRAKEEAEKQAKAEAEQKVKDEAEAKRIQELKPTIEKLHQWVETFEIPKSPLNEENETVSKIIKQFEDFKRIAKIEVLDIK